MFTADLILRIVFLGSLGGFAFVALCRWFWCRPADGCAEGESATGESDAPAPVPGASRRVPVSFYQPLDLLALGFVFLVFFGMQGASEGTKNVPLESRFTAANLMVSVVFHLLMAGFVVFWMTRRVGLAEWLGLRWTKWRRMFLIGPLAVLGMWVVEGVLHFSGYMKWVEGALRVEGTQDAVKLLKTSHNTGALAVMTIAAVLAAPICEETVFRGFLYPVAKRFAGPWMAAVFSGLVFAAAHGNVPDLLPLFLLGTVLSIAYETTGSLWAPIFIHFCFNGATVGLLFADRICHLSTSPTP